MAQRKTTSSSRSSDRPKRSGRAGGSGRSSRAGGSEETTQSSGETTQSSEETTQPGATGGGRASRAVSTGAGSREASRPKPRGAGRPARNRSTASTSGRGRTSSARQAANSSSSRELGDRPPADEPDVFLDVPNVHVGKLEIDVERLEAHLALRAQVADLVNLVAGVHVGVDKVKIDLEDVDASATLKVRLQNVYNILERTLTTIDENPEILQGVLNTAGNAMEQVGEIGSEATKPGGAISSLTSGVGDTLGSLGDTLSRSLTGVTDKLNGKGLASAVRRSGSDADANDPPSGDGMVAKAAAGLAAGGVASLLGGALYRAQRRPRVLGVPVGRAHGLERVAQQIGKLGGQVTAGRKELNRARTTTERLLP